MGEVGEYLVATTGASNSSSAYMMLWIEGNFGTQFEKGLIRGFTSFRGNAGDCLVCFLFSSIHLQFQCIWTGPM